MSEVKIKLTGEERYFQSLPPKKKRDEEKFIKWVDEAFTIFGFDKEKCYAVPKV